MLALGYTPARMRLHLAALPVVTGVPIAQPVTYLRFAMVRWRETCRRNRSRLGHSPVGAVVRARLGDGDSTARRPLTR